MVSFADAITKISVAGKNIKEIPANPYSISKIISKDIPSEKLSLRNQLRTDVYVNHVGEPRSYIDLANRYKGQLDSCGEWAPWSKLK